jgi:hypothetical protein
LKVTCILELSLKTPKTVRCTYQIQIQPCVKVSVVARRRGLRTKWMRLKQDPRGRYAPSATILDTRNAPKHLSFPLPLLHHQQLVHVDVVPVATTKECSDCTCLCYRVVIIELLSLVVVLQYLNNFILQGVVIFELMHVIVL